MQLYLYRNYVTMYNFQTSSKERGLAWFTCDEWMNAAPLIYFFTRHPVTVVDSAERKLLRAFRRRQSSSPASLLFLDPRGLRFFLLCFQVTAIRKLFQEARIWKPEALGIYYGVMVIPPSRIPQDGTYDS